MSLQSHMHSRGVRFAAHLAGEGAAAAAEIYATDTWKEPPVVHFDTPLAIKAGQAIEYRCDYQSTEPHDVIHGLTEADEMCQLIGPYYPRDMQLEACQDEDGGPAATWTGSGSATCGQTLGCLMKAAPIEEDGGRTAWGCVLDSCPAAAEAVSELMRCRLTEGRGECSDECAQGAVACESCLSGACEEAVGACLSSECN